MMVRCPRPLQMPMRYSQPTAPTVLVSPLVCACSHHLTGVALLACAVTGCATGGCADELTRTSAMSWEALAVGPGRGRSRPPPSPCTATSPTTRSTTAVRGVDAGLPAASRRCCVEAAFRRARGCRGYGGVLRARVGPDAARAGSEACEERARRLEVSSLHAHGVARRFTCGGPFG